MSERRTSSAPRGGRWAEVMSAVGWVLTSWIHPADRESGWEQRAGQSPPTREPGVSGQTSHPQVTSTQKSTPTGGG